MRPTNFRELLDWIDDEARRRTPMYELATDNRIYVAVIMLAAVGEILSMIFS